MKKVIIMRGCSGSGKSTYAATSLIKHLVPTTICSADHFWVDKEGNYNFDPTKLNEAHAECYQHFVRALENETHLVIVDNTNTTLAEIAPYLTHAKYMNYEVEIVRCTCNWKTAAKRNIHNVPKKSIESMYKRMQSIPKHWPKETVVTTED